jgi:hypothetical protein
VHLDELGTEGDDLARPLRLVGDADQVDDHSLAVRLGRLDGTGDGAVTRRAEHRDQVGTGGEGDVRLELSGIHRLQIGEDDLVGVGLLHGGDRRQSGALDERRAELEDVDVRRRGGGELEGGLGGERVHGELQFHRVLIGVSRAAGCRR